LKAERVRTERDAAQKEFERLQTEAETQRTNLIALRRDLDDTQRKLVEARDRHDLENKQPETVRNEISVFLGALSTKSKRSHHRGQEAQRRRWQVTAAEQRFEELKDIEARVKQAQQSLKGGNNSASPRRKTSPALRSSARS